MSRKGSRQADKGKGKDKKVPSGTTAVESWLADRLRIVVPIGWVIGVAAVVVCGIVLLERMSDYVYSQPEFRTELKLVLEVPEEDRWVKDEGWEPRILSAISLPDDVRGTDCNLHDDIVADLIASGWVSSVDRVVRDVDGTIRIGCQYRRPIAMVEAGDWYFAVDRDGYRLPGKYLNVEESLWIKLVGIQSPTPQEGGRYEGYDAHSAIELAEAMAQQPYWRLIEAIDVGQCGTISRPGRDRIKVYIRGRRGGEPILWGSPLGTGFEENTPAQRFQLFGRLLATDLPEGEIDPTVYPNAVIIRRTAAEDATDGLAQRTP